MVQRNFDEELTSLRGLLANMGTLAESMIRQSAKLFQKSDPNVFEQILHDEDDVNRLHMEIDNACMRLFVLRQPAAVDLRLLASMLKMSGELERIGDQSVNLMKRAKLIEKYPTIEMPIDLTPMYDVITRMVNDCLDAFSRQDVALAKSVLELEHSADDLRHEMEGELARAGEQRGSDVQFYIQLTLIVYHLERIGDHATNIAEDVIFIVEGQDVRHHNID